MLYFVSWRFIVLIFILPLPGQLDLAPEGVLLLKERKLLCLPVAPDDVAPLLARHRPHPPPVHQAEDCSSHLW